MSYQVSRSKHSTFGNGIVSISLPSLPFDLPPASTDETKPALPPVMGKLSADDKRWLRSIARVKG